MPPERHIVVAVNPAAAFGRRREAGTQVVARIAGAGHRVTELREANFELLRREAERAVAVGEVEQADALVVVGGDGMVSLGVNIVARTGIPLGVVPAGTGNDLARGLGLPLDDVDGCVDLILAALERPRPIDAVLVRHGELTTWFASVLSAGFDAVVNERANRMVWPKSPVRYTIAVLLELLPFRAPEYTITIDGVATTQRAMLVAAGNNTSLGGGMLVLPEAQLDDGLLDVLVADRMSKRRLLQLFPKAFRGAHLGEPEIHVSRGRQVRIEGEGIVAYADGERVGPLPVTAEAVPGALLVLAPWPAADLSGAAGV